MSGTMCGSSMRSAGPPAASAATAGAGCWRGLLLACSLVVVSLAHSPVARAQEPEATPSTAPAVSEGDLVRKGVSLREQGKDAEALELFRTAYERHKTPRAHAQMGLAEQALGRWVEAEADLEGALGVADDAWITGNRAALEGALEQIRRRLGSLEILCETPGGELWIDGRLIGRLPMPRPIRLPAGTVSVRIQAPGHTSVNRSVEVVAGRLGRETFHMMPLEAVPNTPPPGLSARVTEPPPSPAPPGQRRVVPRGVFWATVAATVVAGGLTTWSGLDVLSANRDYEANPTREGYNGGRSRERRTNWLGGATAVLGISATLIGLFATDLRGP